MNNSIVIALLLLYIGYFQRASGQDDKVRVLNDFVELDRVPTTLTIMTCWDEDIKFQILKSARGPVYFPKSYKIQKKLFAVNPHQHLIVVDSTCKDIKATMKKVEPKLFAAPFHWLIFCEPKKKLDILKPINMLIDSNVILAEKTKTGYQLNHVYRMENGGEFIFQKLGTWNRAGTEGIIDERKNKVLCITRKDFRKKTITTSHVILNNSSYSHLTDYAERTKDAISKLNYVVLKDFFTIFNVTRVEIFHDAWGILDPKTKKFTAMVGDVLYRKADIAGTPAFMMANRVGFIDFAKLTTPTHGRFVFRAPQMSSVANLYTLPFDKYVWFSALLLSFLSAVFIYVTMILEKRSSERNVIHKQKNIDMKTRFTDSALTIVAAITQMGPLVDPKLQSSKIIMFFIFLSLSFLYTSYTANIVSLLQSPSFDIKTAEDILKSQLKLGVEDTPYNRHYFALFDDPIRKKIYDTKIAPKGKKDNFIPLGEGIAKVRNKMYAFFFEVSSGYQTMQDTYYEHEKCNLVDIDFVPLASSDPALMLPVGSPYREIWNVHFLRMIEHGLRSKHQNRLYTKKPICASSQSFQSVGIIDCYPVLLLIPWGMLLSLIIFIVEKIVASSKNIDGKFCTTI